MEVEVPIDSSVWIAARTLGPPQHGAMDSYLFAHTNPVFVIADGEPIRSSEDAAFFVAWIEETLSDLRRMDRWDDPAHRDEVLATFEEALRLYQDQAGGVDRPTAPEEARSRMGGSGDSSPPSNPLFDRGSR